MGTWVCNCADCPCPVLRTYYQRPTCDDCRAGRHLCEGCDVRGRVLHYFEGRSVCHPCEQAARERAERA